MAWKDYETLDVTREIATKKEMEKLRRQHELNLKNEDLLHKPDNKGGRANVFKKRYSQ